MSTQQLIGTAIAPGMSYAPAYLVKRSQFETPQTQTTNTHKSWTDISKEKAAFERALKQSQERLTQIREMALKKSGPQKAEIFDAHLIMLEDPELIDEIERCIDAGDTAVQAVQKTTQRFARTLAEMDDPYFRDRANDVLDLARHLVAHLYGIEIFDPQSITEPVVLVADEIFPSEVAFFDRKLIRGVVSTQGGVTSHSAILLKNLEIPTVFGIAHATDSIKNGEWLFLDGIQGRVHALGFESNDNDQYVSAVATWEKERSDLYEIRHQPTVTIDGIKAYLQVNLSSPKDISVAKEYGAEGVGLFRTEFLFMERSSAPTENEQFEVYRQVLQAFRPRKVVIRTMDIGGDKPIPYLQQDKEENPFLGLRGLRYCLKHQELFREQLRALLRASAYGSLHIMFPMVSIVSEMIQARRIAEEEAELLRARDITIGTDIKLGMMIEVPSAAIQAQQFAEHVDFFSIGTNDLTQYVMAADRMNVKVNELCDHGHPAVLELVRHVIEVAHREQKGISICGELAGDPKYTETLLKMGLREFSMSRSQLLRIKAEVRKSTTMRTQNLKA